MRSILSTVFILTALAITGCSESGGGGEPKIKSGGDTSMGPAPLPGSPGGVGNNNTPGAAAE